MSGRGRRGAEGPGSEGGARLPGAESAVAAAPPPQPGGWLGAGRRGPGRGAEGGRGRGGGGGLLDSSLRQAAARAHLPAAARGRVIGCLRRAREIELSIHSRAGLVCSAVAELSPPAPGEARRLLLLEGRVPARGVDAPGCRRRLLQ